MVRSETWTLDTLGSTSVRASFVAGSARLTDHHRGAAGSGCGAAGRVRCSDPAAWPPHLTATTSSPTMRTAVCPCSTRWENWSAASDTASCRVSGSPTAACGSRDGTVVETPPARSGHIDPVYMSRKIRKFRTDKFDTWNKRHIWGPAVYMSCMSQNCRLFHVSNLSVRNFEFFCWCIRGHCVLFQVSVRPACRDVYCVLPRLSIRSASTNMYSPGSR